MTDMKHYSNPIIFAHRGANRRAPENTLAAFQMAYDFGARAVEFDVQLSKDFVPVVIHDESLERTTSGEGLVSQQTFAKLKKLDAGAWFADEFSKETIPSLAEVLQLLIPLNCYLNIELKPNKTGVQALIEQVLELLKKLQCSKEQILLSSFSENVIDQLFKRSSEFDYAWLIDRIHPESGRLAQERGCVSIHPSIKILQNAGSTWIEEMHQLNLKVYAYTINDPELAKVWIEAGLDGFFTDNEILYKAL